MGQESERTGFIDIMNYPFTAEAQKRLWDTEDFRHMTRTLFNARDEVKKNPDDTAAKFVAAMDRVGCDKVFICAPKMYSFFERRLIWDFTVDEVHSMIKDFPERLVGIAGYNPYRIEESLREVEHGVKDLGFKGVYVHVYGFDVPINDKSLYPLYAKCVELKVPVSLQTGHSLERMPSGHGRPILIDEVALAFPNLRLVLSHTGWPWVEEAVAMAWKHEHVYLDISAHPPVYLDQSLVKFMDTRGRNKTIFGTNSANMQTCIDQFNQLKVRDETKQKVLRGNAIKVYGL